MSPFKPMQIALDEARKASLLDEVPVGAVIVHGETGEIISATHNEMVRNANPTAHAEMLAIQRACQILGKSRLVDYDIYVTLEPCPMCAQAISFARFRRLHFGAYDPKAGGVEHGPRIFHSSSCFHQPEVIGGIEEVPCGEILKEFFQSKR